MYDFQSHSPFSIVIQHSSLWCFRLSISVRACSGYRNFPIRGNRSFFQCYVKPKLEKNILWTLSVITRFIVKCLKYKCIEYFSEISIPISTEETTTCGANVTADSHSPRPHCPTFCVPRLVLSMNKCSIVSSL